MAVRVGLLSALVALTTLAQNAVLGAAQQNQRESEIRALVEEKIDVNGPGVAILVSRHGVPSHMAGYGMADVKAGTPITPDSLFDLASVSKHMTGVAILTLVEKGTLKLDQPVAQCLEDFAVPVKGRAVTVTDLLHHVSGLADYTSDDTIISGQSQELAWTNGRYDNGKPIKDEDVDGYGLGWVVDKDRHTVSHSGSWNGTASYLLLDLQKGFTVAVLSNDENTEVGSLAEEILALFTGD